MIRRNKLIALVLLLTVLCMLFAACNNKEEETEKGIIKTDLSPVCAGRTSKTVSNTKINVNFCDCNALGVILDESGSTTSLSRHTIAKIPDSVFGSFDALGEKYAELLAGYDVTIKEKKYTVSADDAKFGAVCAQAQSVFSSSDFPICKNVKYNVSKSAVVGLNNKFCIASDTSYDYLDMFFLVSELFGYKSSEIFRTYCGNLVTAYGGEKFPADVEKNRLRLDGAICTKNGSYIMPYVVSSDLSSYFVALVVLDKDGNLTAWVSSIDSVAYAVDYSEKATTVKNVYLYGRCRLFETASGYYRFSLNGDIPADTLYATIKLATDDGLEKTLTVILLPEYAKKTVENFVTYAEEGFFDGTVVHRIVSGTCLQGGEYNYYSGSGYKTKKTTHDAIEGEFTNNGHPENVIGHCPGTISMARTSAVNSATAGFFLCYGDCQPYDGAYAGFGFMPYAEDIAFIANIGDTTRTTGGQDSHVISRIITIKEVKIWNHKVEEKPTDE